MRDLLLLHGALGSAGQFNQLASMLSENFNVHTLNFSGHGGDTIPDEKFSLNLFCDNISEYIEKQNLSQISIFGYSMGGYAAIAFGNRHPGKVKAIFTLATVFDWSPERAAKETALLNPDKILQKLPSFANVLELRHAPQDWKRVLHKTAEFMTELGENHLTKEHFANIECPVRIGVGDRDKMVSVESSLNVSRLFVNGSLVVLPDTVHPFDLVNLKRLEYEIMEFFKDL